MTDKEKKAEEYIINKYKLNKCYIVDTEETRIYMHNDVHSEYEEEYQIYLDGLAEGRKEVREHETTCVNRLHHIEKENAELKWQLKEVIEDNDYYQKENTELEKDKEYLDKVNNEQTEVILKLNEQIEKMKPYCKCLCKNYSKFSVMGNDCVNGVCRNCDKWELAE